MKASRWGGRIVVLSVLSMLLAVGSIALPYYEAGYYEAYLMTSLNSGLAEDFNGLANATLGLLMIYLGVSIAYIVTVMRGVGWVSLYLGGAACALAAFTTFYFAYRVGQIASIYEEQNPPHEWTGAYSIGFLALILVAVVQFASAVMRGWILGGHADKAKTAYIGDYLTGTEEAESWPFMRKQD